MTKKWREVRVDEIASHIAMGPFGSDITRDNFVEAGVPVIRGGNLSEGRFHANDFVFLTEDKADDLANSNAFPGDLVFTHRGTLGQVGIIPDSPFDRYVVSQSQMKLTCNTNIVNPLFLYYFFRSPIGLHSIMMHKSQTGVPAISRPVTSLKGIRLMLPPLDEQDAIAYILGTLDNKIELNRRMNETLEAIARAIFKSWFLDFDPVYAKMEGLDPGLPPHIADLFPDRLVDSELGEIPEGWNIGFISDEFVVTMGQSPPGSTYNEDGNGLPFYQGRTDFGFRYPSRRMYCTDPKRIAEKSDTLVSVRAPVGDTNVSFERCCIGRGVAAVHHKKGFASYTYYSMQFLKEDFNRYEAEGTVFGSIGKRDFNSLSRKIPTSEVVRAYDNQVAAFDKKVEINEREIQNLGKIRDTLLPRLISGQLRVTNPERFFS